MYPKKELAQLIIAACKEYHIDTVVISPGSRNAPLIIGFSGDDSFDTMQIVDERAAAFFALGIAQQKQKPVAIVCTSGSALLNYYPAVAEAYYSQIPLVVISADRPKNLIDIGDGQTIRQENVFGNHILYSANLKESKTQENLQKVTDAFTLLKTVKGPIHLNAPFDEPLYEMVSEMNVFDIPKPNKSTFDFIDFKNISEIWNQAKKKMILVGVHYPDEELEVLVDTVANDPSVLVFTETTSNLRNKRFVNSIDNVIFNLSDDQFRDLQPEILLTFGGLIVSKKIKKFLRDYSPKNHWHVNELRAFDTFFSLTHHFKIDEISFFKEFTKWIYPKQSNYETKWITYRDSLRLKHNRFLKKSQYSDLKVFETVLESIPDNTQIQFSNSSVIRYSQLFQLKKNQHVFCNRGTSGIDGSTSTAIGAAYAIKNQVVLITGDLSFFYDSNALWNNYIPNNFRIILINNSGGGIFKIIPGPESTDSIDYFTAPHNLKANHLCDMFGFDYISVNNQDSLKNYLHEFFKEGNQPKLLEIFTPSEINDKILKEYINSLR